MNSTFRELKFRAWHPDRCGGMFIARGMTILDFIADANENLEIPMFIMHDKGVIIEQFTGLQDVNGVDIYEGDIIHATDNAAIKILGEQTTDTVEYDQDQCCFAAFGMTVATWNIEGFEYKVIGNIHEMP